MPVKILYIWRLLLLSFFFSFPVQRVIRFFFLGRVVSCAPPPGCLPAYHTTNKFLIRTSSRSTLIMGGGNIIGVFFLVYIKHRFSFPPSPPPRYYIIITNTLLYCCWFTSKNSLHSLYLYLSLTPHSYISSTTTTTITYLLYIID